MMLFFHHILITGVLSAGILRALSFYTAAPIIRLHYSPLSEWGSGYTFSEVTKIG
jgi:hypothetical protein